MSGNSKPEPSALKAWAMVLGFLAVLLVVLGGVGYGMGLVGGPKVRGHVTSATDTRTGEVRH